MMTDFTAVNTAIQSIIDDAIAPLTAQVTTLTGQLGAANDTVTTQAQTILDLKAQLAAAGGTAMIWFKGDQKPNIYVYNPLTGTKRQITSAEGAMLRTDTKASGWQLITVPQATADAIPLAS